MDKVKLTKIITWCVGGLAVIGYGVLSVFYPETLETVKTWANEQWAVYGTTAIAVASSTGAITGLKLGQLIYNAKSVKATMAVYTAQLQAQSKQINLLININEGYGKVLEAINAKDANKTRREATSTLITKLQEATTLVKKYDISKLTDEDVSKSLDGVDDIYNKVKSVITK